MKFAPAILAAALAGLVPAAAQTETITTELLTLSFNGTSPGYYYRNGKEVARLDASRQGISAPVFYRGPRLLSLYKEAADLNPPESGREPPKPILQVRLPLDNDRILLLFSYPREKKGDALPQVRALGISTRDMKEGDYRVFNLSSQTVYAILNEQKATIPSGRPVDLSSTSWRSEALDMNVQFGLSDKGRFRPVYSSVWGHRPVRRMFLFLFDRPDKFRPLDIRMFYDVPSIKAARGDNAPDKDKSPSR